MPHADGAGAVGEGLLAREKRKQALSVPRRPQAMRRLRAAARQPAPPARGGEQRSHVQALSARGWLAVPPWKLRRFSRSGGAGGLPRTPKGRARDKATLVWSFNCNALGDTGGLAFLLGTAEAHGAHVLVLQSTRWRFTGAGKLVGFHLFWAPSGEGRHVVDGVCIAVHESWAKGARMTPRVYCPGRVLSLTVQGCGVSCTVVGAYAPIDAAPERERSTFWSSLSNAVGKARGR